MTEENAFEIICRDGTFAVSSETSDRVMFQSEYFRSALDSDKFMEGKTRSLDKRDCLSVKAAEHMIGLLAYGAEYKINLDATDLAMLFRTLHEIGVEDSSCGIRGYPLSEEGLLAISNRLEEITKVGVSSDAYELTLENLSSQILVPLENASDLTLIPILHNIAMYWNGFDESQTPQTSYGGLTSARWEYWHLGGDNSLSVKISLPKERFESLTEVVSYIQSLFLDAAITPKQSYAAVCFKAEKLLNDSPGGLTMEVVNGKCKIKHDIDALSRYDFVSNLADSDRLITAMAMCREEYTKTFRTKEGADKWFSKFRIATRFDHVTESAFLTILLGLQETTICTNLKGSYYILTTWDKVVELFESFSTASNDGDGARASTDKCTLTFVRKDPMM